MDSGRPFTWQGLVSASGRPRSIQRELSRQVVGRLRREGALVHELYSAGLIVPASFADLDEMPFRVTAAGNAYVRQTADA